MKEGPPIPQRRKIGRFGSTAGIAGVIVAIGILTVSVWPSSEQSSPENNKPPASGSTFNLEPTREPVRQNFKDVIVKVEGSGEMQVPGSEDINFDASGFTIEFKGVKIPRPSSDSPMSVILASKGELGFTTRLKFRVDYQLEKESGKVRRRVLAELPYVSSKNICETIILGENGVDQSLVSLEEFLKPTDYKYVSDNGKISIFVGGKLNSENVLAVANQPCSNRENWVLAQSGGAGLQNAMIGEVRIKSHADKAENVK